MWSFFANFQFLLLPKAKIGCCRGQGGINTRDGLSTFHLGYTQFEIGKILDKNQKRLAKSDD